MYATVQDCIDRLGDEAVLLLADVKGADPPAYTALETALSDASDEIDAYVGSRHPLPLDPAPRLLQRICVEIAVYRRSATAGPVTKERKTRYESAVQLLDDISTGKASLGAADPEPPAQADSSGVQFELPPRALDRESLRRMF